MKKQEIYNNIISKSAIELGLNELEIHTITKCKCGALSVEFSNGENNSMRPSTFKKIFGITLKRKVSMWCCNHCVNHYGIDLCQCGSGSKVGYCSCGGVNAREAIGESVQFNFLGITLPKKVNLIRLEHE